MTPAPAPGAVAAPGERWWHDPPALQRYFSDVVLSEVQALRPGRPAPSPWADDADLVSALQLDSLEWLALSAALTALAPGPVTELGEPPRRAADWLRWLRQALDQAPALQGFRSSGSTGLPRQHHHPIRLQRAGRPHLHVLPRPPPAVRHVEDELHRRPIVVVHRQAEHHLPRRLIHPRPPPQIGRAHV